MLEVLKMYMGSTIDRIGPSRIAKNRSCICLGLSLKLKKNGGWEGSQGKYWLVLPYLLMAVL